MKKDKRNTEKFKYFFALLIVISLVSFSACDNNKQANGTTNNVLTDELCTQFPDEFKGLIKGKKLYVTSIGQSGDITRLSNYLEGIGINYIENKTMTADEATNGSVVFLVAGCSIKGLAEHGLTIENELQRVTGFVNCAKTKNLTLVGWHIGGEARRGYSSDGIIKYVFENVNLALFTKNGNIPSGAGKYDLSNWASQAGTKYCQLDDYAQVLDAVKLLGGVNI